jgi:hypothetical protein
MAEFLDGATESGLGVRFGTTDRNGALAEQHHRAQASA